jgi:hypothetical protein
VSKDKFEMPSDRGEHSGIPKMPFDFPTFKLPDGSTITLSDMVYQSMRSAFVVRPWGNEEHWDLFTAGRGQDIPGAAPGTKATRAHTNIPRSGDSGLPKDWEALVCRWRASLNVPLEQPVLDWASETSVQYEYNGKYYADETLADLLFGTQSLGGEALPIHMRENLSYKVHVETSDKRTLEALRTWLRGPGAEAVRDALTELDTVARLADGKIADAIRHVQAKLQPGRQLVGWIHLEGLLKRCIV